MDFLDACGAGEIERRLLVIAGDQTCADAKRMKPANRLRRVGPERVAERKQSEQFAVTRDRDDRQSLRFEFVDPRLSRRKVHSLVREKRRVSNHQVATFEARFDAPTGNGLEPLDLRQSDAAIESLFDNGAGERMFGT